MSLAHDTVHLNTKTKTKTKTKTETKIKSKFRKYLTYAIFSKSSGCKDIKYDIFIMLTQTRTRTTRWTRRTRTPRTTRWTR